MEAHSSGSLFTSRPNVRKRVAYFAAKRLLDLVLCGAALPVVLPLLVVIAAGVKLSSPGTVFYCGLRTGRNGVPFRIYKFRTMIMNAEAKGGGTTRLNDPRVFPFGRFIRRYKLDELPQIFNVLEGSMSLVGPRPELERYTRLYTPEEKAILSVKPGVTDYSSIRFAALDEVVGSADADRIFEQVVLPEKNRLRLKYASSCSLLVDVKILLLTVVALVRKAAK